VLTVGLTGGYASGKSFIAAELERLGAKLIRADDLARAAMEPGGPACADVVREFGPEILHPDGTINRRKLAAIVFPDEARLKRLNALIHPHVFREEQARIQSIQAAFKARGESVIVVVEAAIMIEVGSSNRYDKLVVAACPDELQVSRAMERDGATEPEVRARLARQMPLAEKVRLADYVIDTSGTKEQTLAQTRNVWKALQETASRHQVAPHGQGEELR
jgi:dephospho-CoA kinase